MTEPLRVLFSFILLTSLEFGLGSLVCGSECFMQSYMHMRCQARQLDSYSSARHCSTARQLLDRPRQTSTELDAQAHGVRLDRLDRNSTVTRQARQARPRQRLDSASTAPRQCLDGASTARQLDSQGSRKKNNHSWQTPPCTNPVSKSGKQREKKKEENTTRHSCYVASLQSLSFYRGGRTALLAPPGRPQWPTFFRVGSYLYPR